MKYQLIVTFETDRDMTPDELSAMHYSVKVQVSEPMTWEGADLDLIPSDLRTAAIELDLHQVGE